jgi:hypothetical protein
MRLRAATDQPAATASVSKSIHKIESAVSSVTGKGTARRRVACLSDSAALDRLSILEVTSADYSAARLSLTISRFRLM